MVSTVSSFDLDNVHKVQFQSQDTFLKAAEYMIDFGRDLLTKPTTTTDDYEFYDYDNYTDSNYSNYSNNPQPPGQQTVTFVTVGQYSRLHHMRLVVDLDTNCRYDSLPCYTSNASRDVAGDGTGLPLLFTSNELWNRMDNAPLYLYGRPDLLSAVVFSAAQGSDNATEALRRIELLANDTGYLSTFG